MEEKREMVEIRYSNSNEVADLAGQTVREARKQFKSEFSIPDKAKAKLNGRLGQPIAYSNFYQMSRQKSFGGYGMNMKQDLFQRQSLLEL